MTDHDPLRPFFADGAVRLTIESDDPDGRSTAHIGLEGIIRDSGKCSFSIQAVDGSPNLPYEFVVDDRFAMRSSMTFDVVIRLRVQRNDAARAIGYVRWDDHTKPRADE